MITYENSRLKAMNDMVADKVYHVGSEHAASTKNLVRSVLLPVLLRRKQDEPVSILDCGCGVGAWLDFIAHIIPASHRVNLYGFDLNPELVRLAEQRLHNCPHPVFLRQGDILKPESYQAANGQTHYDIVFTYDVVQQLPKKLQSMAVHCMMNHRKTSGAVIVVDSDGRSAFGRRMALKKWITRYFYVPLVPRYYIVARYPALGTMARAITTKGDNWTQIVSQSDTVKQALIIHPTSNQHPQI